MIVTRHLRIVGRVQGVYYRESMRAQAETLGVAGWVRNRRDGSVEALIQGSPDAVRTLIAWARIGPPAARVDTLEISEAEGAFQGFLRLPTE